MDRLEVILDDGEVGARLIDLAEGEGMFVSACEITPEEG